MPEKLTVPVIDLFAGPGGLSEGFVSAAAPDIQFKIALSLEKDAAAYRTLRLRAFFRQFSPETVPDEYYGYLRGQIPWAELADRYPRQAQLAEAACMQAELGGADDAAIYDRVRAVLSEPSPCWVLIGGPPCQAYSLVGRARMADRPREVFEADRRHHLYREYLKILCRFSPHIFVMENVKGLLSATLRGESTFRRILTDLAHPAKALGMDKALEYRIIPINGGPSSAEELTAEACVMRAEEYGVPQKRHRVVLLGVRHDLAPRLPAKFAFYPEAFTSPPAVFEVTNDLPALRSRLSREQDSPETWLQAVLQGLDHCLRDCKDPLFRKVLSDSGKTAAWHTDTGSRFVRTTKPRYMGRELQLWYLDERLGGVCNHESRPHRRDDLWRYLFVSAFGLTYNRSPKLVDFPDILMPRHRNAELSRRLRQLFDDRFRVQLASAPATTVTAHLAKDGHYYIHHDPSQCRSWTVREAARIQTFPDNYFFEGTRTEQYIQVGNAVPPLLARTVAERVATVIRSVGLCS